MGHGVNSHKMFLITNVENVKSESKVRISSCGRESSRKILAIVPRTC